MGIYLKMINDIGSLVIVNNNGVLVIGIIHRITKRRGVKSYHIKTESGSMFMGIGVDNQKSMIFIDSNKTNQFINSITSTLNDGDKNQQQL